ncbi:MAG: phosphate/phosphite/phosphonate ABC transporter substrate-binding protein [Planctomycetota bacterium]
MKLRSVSTYALLSVFGLGLAACGSDSAAGETPAVIRVSAIPDMNKSLIAETQKKLCDYLTKKVGVEVRFEPSNDYTAAVNGLLANKLDLVWYGGVTSVEVEADAKGHAVFVATRDIDLKFKSYIIGNKDAVAAGKVGKLDSLKDLKGMAKDLTFTFGSKKSTSGHIMPRHFMVEAGIDPEQDFKSPAAYSGNHSATLTQVASGATDVGALNYSTYDNADKAQQEQAPILYTTPFYVDYCWIGHDRLGNGTLDKIKAALLSLDASQPDEKAILDAWGCSKFVAADSKQWDGIRSVLKALPKDFLNSK